MIITDICILYIYVNGLLKPDHSNSFMDITISITDRMGNEQNMLRIYHTYYTVYNEKVLVAPKEKCVYTHD